MMMLLASPYRRGTDDDPARMAANLHQLEAAARPLFRAGHLPMSGEWVALPLLAQAGSTRPGDAPYEEILYPVAHQLLAKCDAVLRWPGLFKGAHEDVRVAQQRGLPVY